MHAFAQLQEIELCVGWVVQPLILACAIFCSDPSLFLLLLFATLAVVWKDVRFFGIESKR